jgi:DNA-binding LacI/PurR family transcriptional regulator
MPKKAVTIRDVAREAGVSVATASRALNANAIVNARTRERVLSIMSELGFTPSPAARRLSLGRTLTVGVVVSFLTRPQAAERLRGVDAVLSDSEFDLVIYNVESVQKRDHILATLGHSQRTDGLIVMSLPPAGDGAPLVSSSVPVVFIDVHTPAVANLPRVIGDDRAGAALAACHLLDLGHRDIAFVGDSIHEPFGFTSSRDRQAGLTGELATAGVTIRPDWIGHGAHGRYEARDLAHRMLSADDRPTAVFAASDTQALGVIAAARDLGLRVPDDLSVIGYDDIEAGGDRGGTTINPRHLE